MFDPSFALARAELRRTSKLGGNKICLINCSPPSLKLRKGKQSREVEIMFDKLQQLKELKKMRDDAMRIQKTLDGEVVETEKNGVKVRVTLAQRFIEIDSSGKDDSDVVEAVNEAVKESQKQAAKKMQGMVGMDGLKGMLGGGGQG
jgi:DNA-binding protein YbaB